MGGELLMETDAERFADIADAIRSKTGGTAAIKATAFATAIRGIPTGYPRRVTERSVNPGMSNLDGAYQAMLAAMSFWQAKQSGTRTFAYSDGNGVLKKSGMVNDSSGRAVMDCSTYIGLALRGYGYADTPYAKTSDAGATVDGTTVTCRSQAWAEPYLDKQTDPSASDLRVTGGDGLYRCLTAADIAAYYEAYGLAWEPGERQPRTGDLCFFDKRDADGTLHYPTRWRGISHIGIMTDPSAFLNITDYSATGNVIRTAVSSRAPMLYARPLYGGLSSGASGDLSASRGENLLPALWAGFKQGQSSVSGVTATCSARKLTFSGTSTAAISKKLVHESCPLYLPAGKYRLSGFKNGTGTNTVSATHSMWGLRVYYSSGAGVPGTTWSSNGANSASRTPCWDIGAGCEFQLSSASSIVVDFYVGKRDCGKLSIDPVLKRVG